MPAPARISVVVKPTTQLDGTDTDLKPRLSRPKGRIVPRRRGRGRVDETDSEEELVREPRSDSESEAATSTVGSDTASEFESETEEEPKPPSDESVSSLARPRVTTTTTIEGDSNDSSFFPRQESWSDMMMNQPTDGLPIVQFSELNLQESVAMTQQQQQRSAVPSPPPSDHEQNSKTELGVQPSVRGGKASRFSRKPGQSAREAYINRLNNDPAYVPTVGQFWSHDDRLLDKDLRSLSTWWRGKWQGRGRGVRGRGNFANGWSARGRGAFRNMGNRMDVPNVTQSEAAWSHDKFDDVKETVSNRERNNFTRGGRGSKTRNFPRKETDRARSPDASSHSPAQPPQSVNDILRFGDGQRTWFAMKPERVWTKQFDGYLHFDAQLKPLQVQGLGQGVRVKLPRNGNNSGEHEPVIIRLPLDTSQMSNSAQAVPSDTDTPKSFAVKLPSLKSIGKQKETLVENVTTISPLHVNEQLPSTPIATPFQEPSSSRVVLEAPRPWNAETTLASNQLPAPTAQMNGEVPASSSTEVPVVSSTSQPSQLSAAPPIPVLSPFQPSSSYASPYMYSGHGLPLPPGIAIAENGVTYEIATGRAVYLQTPPPPPPHISIQAPVFNPRPMAMAHSHHNSMSFANAMPLSVSPSGFLPTPPLFVLPRQSSRIEIRAPGDPKPNNNRESQRTSQDRLSDPKGADTFAPNGQVGSYYTEGQPMYAPSTYYYPYAHDGSASFNYGQYSNIDSNQTYEHYNQDPYSQHSTYY